MISEMTIVIGADDVNFEHRSWLHCAILTTQQGRYDVNCRRTSSSGHFPVSEIGYQIIVEHNEVNRLSKEFK
jgi:hypothetical protein